MAVHSLTTTVRTQLSSALSQLAKGVSLPLLFRMADGVQQALTHWRRLTNMARVVSAKMTAEEVIGQIMFTSFKMKLTVSVSLFFRSTLEYNTFRQMFNVNNSRINLKGKQLYEVRQLVCVRQLGKRAP